MRLSKLGRLLADLVRVNVRYATDPAQRSGLRAVLRRNGLTAAQRRIVDREIVSIAPAALPYRGLTTGSLAIACARSSPDASARLNLVIGEVREEGVFAGIHTALTVAKSLAARLELPLRVIMLDFTSADNSKEKAERYLRDAFDVHDAIVVPRERIHDTIFGSSDIWLATHWKTAHAVHVACEVGTISPSRVIYLIQDYEPGFSPWSTDSVLASATYHAGFTPIINSVPLWAHLTRRESLTVDREQVFAPRFDDDTLRRVAAARTTSDTVTVLFYGRPTKHRNLFGLGVSALRSAALRLGDDAAAVTFLSVGEPHENLDLGSGATLVSLGRLSWHEYFEALTTTDVALSLQQSPHPSHPPFDAAISGAWAITNEFDSTRHGLHPRIQPVPPRTTDLGDALVEAIRSAKAAEPAGYLPVEEGLLGGTLERAVEAVARLLER